MSNMYDATLLKEKGMELMERISNDVNAYESFYIGAIPSKLKVTKKQYKDLASKDAFEGMMVINEIEGKIRPAQGAEFFYTKETVNVFNKRSGGYVLEVEIQDNA